MFSPNFILRRIEFAPNRVVPNEVCAKTVAQSTVIPCMVQNVDIGSNLNGFADITYVMRRQIYKSFLSSLLIQEIVNISYMIT